MAVPQAPFVKAKLFFTSSIATRNLKPKNLLWQLSATIILNLSTALPVTVPNALIIRKGVLTWGIVV